MKISYLEYRLKQNWSAFFHIVIWSSLAVFTTMVKASILDDVPALQTVEAVMAIMGSHLAFKRITDLKVMMWIILGLNIMFEIIFIWLVFNDGSMEMIAYLISGLIALLALSKPMEGELVRKFEMSFSKKQHELLTKVYKKKVVLFSYATVVGAIISLIVLTVMNVEIMTFGKILAGAGILCSMWEVYWMRKL